MPETRSLVSTLGMTLFSRAPRLSNGLATGRGEGLADDVAGIPRCGGFEDDDLGFFISHRSMFDAMGDDQKLSWIQLHRVISELDAHPAAPDEEHFVFLFVRVPDEGALEF